MKLILENWREFNQDLLAERQRQEYIDLIFENWAREQERLLNEIDVADSFRKGKEYISQKLNDFFLNLYFQAVNLVSKVISAGLEFSLPLIKAIKLISDKVRNLSVRHPIIGRIAATFIVCLVVLASNTLMTEALAAPEQSDKIQTWVDVLQGVLADQMTDAGGIEKGDAGILPADGSHQFKVLCAEAINQLETTNITSSEELKTLSGESGALIKRAVEFVQSIITEATKSEDSPYDTEVAIQIIDKWKAVGEKITSAFYEHEKIVYEIGGDNIGIKGTRVVSKTKMGFK